MKRSPTPPIMLSGSADPDRAMGHQRTQDGLTLTHAPGRHPTDHESDRSLRMPIKFGGGDSGNSGAIIPLTATVLTPTVAMANDGDNPEVIAAPMTIHSAATAVADCGAIAVERTKRN